MHFAHKFFCERSIYEMEDVLNSAGTWQWRVRDSAWYPDFLQCRPQKGIRSCIYSEEPPNGRSYRCHVEISTSSESERDSVEPVLLKLLEHLGVRELNEVEANEWPFD